MIAIGHTSVGVILASTVVALSPDGQPAIWGFLAVLVLGIALHYITDLIPHGHYYINTKKLSAGQLLVLSADLFGGVVLFLLLTGWSYGFFSLIFWLFVVSIAASQLTDVVEGLSAFGLISKSRLIKKHSQFHLFVHWHNEPTSPNPGYGRTIRWSDLWQLLTFGLALLTFWM